MLGDVNTHLHICQAQAESRWDCEGTQNCKAALQRVTQSKVMIVYLSYGIMRKTDNLLKNLTNACHVISYYKGYF